MRRGAGPWRTWKARAARLFLFLVCALQISLAVHAQQPIENALKATFIFRFAEYVTWPPSSNRPTFVFCIIGPDPFGALIDQAISGEKVGSRQAVVQRLATAGKDTNCDVAFVNASNEQQLATFLAPLQGLPVLIVTDGGNPGPRGSIIHFVVRGGRVRFTINVQAAAANGLTISSRLLDLAVRD